VKVNLPFLAVNFTPFGVGRISQLAVELGIMVRADVWDILLPQEPILNLKSVPQNFGIRAKYQQ
jgi:hypothetical protein